MSNYLGDNPIHNKSEDFFDRWKFAEQIASISVPKSSRSLVISIHGKWGEGKTSLLNMVRTSLPDDVVTITFNPWFFKEENQLLSTFFNNLASALGKKLESKREVIGRLINQYSDAVGVVENIPKLSIPIRIYKFCASIFGIKKPTIEELKHRIGRYIVDSGKNIVIFIDDIDRLDVKEIEITFKLVKLLADFPRTTYILSFDADLVARMLAPQYGGLVPESGHKFIEKIVQLPLSLPRARRSSIHRFVVESIKNVIDNSVLSELEFENKLTDIISPLISTPREAIRYTNGLLFAVPLLYGEVNSVDLALLECLRITTPELYQFIRDNKDFFLVDYHGEQNRHENLRGPAIEKMKLHIKNQTEARKELIKKTVCSLFPRFAWVEENEIQSEKGEKWLLQKRVCSTQYFDRYFGYALRKDEMSDIHFTSVYLSANERTPSELSNLIRADFETFSPDDVILKLVYHRNSIIGRSGENLAIALSLVSDCFPSKSGVNIGNAFSLAATTIHSLIKNMNSGIGSDVARRVIAKSASLEFASEMVARFVMRESDDKKNPLFTDNAAKRVKVSYINRIKELITTGNFLSVLDEGLMLRLLIWWADVDERKVKELILQSLKQNKTSGLKLLRIFTPTLSSISTINGNTTNYKSNFGEEEYTRLSTFVQPEVFYDYLIDVYGNRTNLYLIRVPERNEPIGDMPLVGLFQHMYENKIPKLHVVQYLSWENSKWEANLAGFTAKIELGRTLSYTDPYFFHKSSDGSSSHSSAHINFYAKNGEEWTAICKAQFINNMVNFKFMLNRKDGSTMQESTSMTFLDWDGKTIEVSVPSLNIINDQVVGHPTFNYKKLN